MLYLYFFFLYFPVCVLLFKLETLQHTICKMLFSLILSVPDVQVSEVLGLVSSESFKVVTLSCEINRYNNMSFMIKIRFLFSSSKINNLKIGSL